MRSAYTLIPCLAALALCVLVMSACQREPHHAPASLPAFSLSVSEISTPVAGHAFALQVQLDAGSKDSRARFAGQTLEVSLPATDELLSGTRQASIPASGAISFDSLNLSRTGTYQLKIGIPGYRSRDISVDVEVRPRLGLEFSWIPARAFKDEPFRAVLRVRDQVTRKLSAPDHDTQVSLRSLGSAHELQGARTATFFAGESSLTFDSLRFPAVEQAISLRADGADLFNATSDAFPCDGFRLDYAPLPSRIVSGESVTVALGCVSQLDGRALYPEETLVATLNDTANEVEIGGERIAENQGAWLIFENLPVDGFGQCRLNCGVAGIPLAVSAPLIVAPHFSLRAQGAVLIEPQSSPPTMRLQATRADNTLYVLPQTNAEVRVIHAQSGFVHEQLSLVIPAGESGLDVDLSALQESGVYRVEASVRVPNSTQSIISTIELDVTDALLDSTSPGPFVALPGLRVGREIRTELPSYAKRDLIPDRFGVLSGALPVGITLNQETGELRGVIHEQGSYTFTLYARKGMTAWPIRCALPVFSADDSELDPLLSFRERGPHQVQQSERSYVFRSGFDNKLHATRMLLYHPPIAQMSADTPVLLLHRGRGINAEDYSGLLEHIASHGVLCASIEDTQSFANRYNAPIPLPDYDGQPELGMQSAAFFIKGGVEELRRIALDSSDPLRGHFDPERIVVAGHSRGGGATHEVQALARDVHVRGVIHLMPFDLRYTRQTIKPESAPLLAVPDALPPLPCLIFSAERDGDLIFPIADQLIDRATGPATFATIYGGNHVQVTNAPIAHDQTPFITRAQQQASMANLMLAFIRRWADLDLAQDALLYGDVFSGSDEVGLTTRRNLSEAVIIDDFQDADPAKNSLGGSNGFSGGSREESSFYPDNYGNGFATLNIKHNVLSFSQTSAVYQANFSALDLRNKTHLVFRIAQDGLRGFSFATMDVRLRDALENVANVRVQDRRAPGSAYLPAYDASYQMGFQSFDRFVEVRIPIDTFLLASPSLDQRMVNRIELAFLMDAPPDLNVALDDLRFE